MYVDIGAQRVAMLLLAALLISATFLPLLFNRKSFIPEEEQTSAVA